MTEQTDQAWREQQLVEAHQATIGDLRRAEARVRALEAEVAAGRKFAGEMRDFCSPHGVAVDYADRLVEAMDRAKVQPAPGVREVRVFVQAPSEENADRWAETIRDLVVGEYGDSMRLEVTIHPGGRA